MYSRSRYSLRKTRMQLLQHLSFSADLLALRFVLPDPSSLVCLKGHEGVNHHEAFMWIQFKFIPPLLSTPARHNPLGPEKTPRIPQVIKARHVDIATYLFH